MNRRDCNWMRCALTLAVVSLFAAASMPSDTGAWKCPDGQRCLLVAGKGYRCPLREHGNAASSACCSKQDVVWCEHGAMPDSPQKSSRERTLSRSKCQFENSKASPEATRLPPTTSTVQFAVLSEFALPMAQHASSAVPTLASNIDSRAGPPPAPSRAPPCLT